MPLFFYQNPIMTFNRIFLIGFMGSGKSSTGKKLANLLHFDFFDTDTEIERITGKTISQIFATDGEDFFREKEREIIAELSQKDNVVVSTGGGTPCFFDNMQLMNQTGLTIYLHANPKMLKQRLITNKKQRPQRKIGNPHCRTAFSTRILLPSIPNHRRSV